jgi:hypothetical protein
VAVNTSLAVAGNDQYFLINLEVLGVMCLSYEFERMPLRQFIKVHTTPHAPVIAVSLM